MATCYIERLAIATAMPASPAEKPTHPFGFPHRLYGRFQASWNFVQSWFLIDRRMVRTFPVKKIDEIPIVLFANDHFSLHIEPHTHTSRVKYFLFVKNTTLFVVYNA